MITLVEELYYEDLHLIKVAGDTDHAFKIIISVVFSSLGM